MKRLAILLLLGLVLLGGLVWAFLQSPGYVLITYGSFRYQSNLWVFLGFIFVAWLAAFLINRSLRLVLFSGALVNPWSRRHRARRLGKASERGQRELAEGHWSQALGHLRLAAEKDARPLMHYLGAARAANELGEHAECDQLLDRAVEREPGAALAVGLTRARLLVDRGEYVQARDALKALHQEHPRNIPALRLLQQLHVQLEEWSALCALLPELRKLRVLPAPKLDELERLAWAASLEQGFFDATGDREQVLEQFEQRWKSVPSALRGEPPLVRTYATGLARLGAEAKAEQVLGAAIKRDFDDELVELYGQLQGADSARQLSQAEQWLKQHPQDPILLLALGRLSLRNQLWGKARDYLEASLRFAHRSETCAELARLLAQLGETDRSNQLFQEGLCLLDRQLPAPR